MNLKHLIGDKEKPPHPLANGLVGWWVCRGPDSMVNKLTGERYPVQHAKDVK